MLNDLKFVQGAVARKDFVPELTHFHIKDGFVTGYNGTTSLRSPINLDLEVAPKADQFVKAISHCSEELTKLHLTSGKKLRITSGKFKTFVETVPLSNFPVFQPKGETRVTFNGPILPTLKVLYPFIAVDASRPWACNILLRKGCFYVTNNIVLIQKWMGRDFLFPQDILIPSASVRELLRIGKEPTTLQISENAVTFHYENEAWLASHTNALSWPDIDPILDVGGELGYPPETLFDSCESLVPFLDSLHAVFFYDGFISSSSEPESYGTSIEVEGLKGGPAFNCAQIVALKGVVQRWCLDNYPNKPTTFIGENLRGAIVGIRRP